MKDLKKKEKKSLKIKQKSKLKPELSLGEDEKTWSDSINYKSESDSQLNSTISCKYSVKYRKYNKIYILCFIPILK